MIHGIRESIARHPIPSFLVILYPVTWVLFLPDVLGKSGLGVIPVDVPYQIGVLLATIFGLTGVAFLVTRIADGKAGTGALGRYYYNFRAGPQWYVLAVFGAPLLLLLVDVVTQGTSIFNSLGQLGLQLVTSYLPNMLLVAILISLWEEGSWMAFATARLQRRWGPVVASLIVAPCFGFVHFPLFFVTGGLVNNGRPQGTQIIEYAFYLLILFSVPVRLMITWVFNSTKGALPVVALMHSSFDTSQNLFPAVDGRWLYIAVAAVVAVVLVMTRGRLGYLGTAVEIAATPPVPAPARS